MTCGIVESAIRSFDDLSTSTHVPGNVYSTAHNDNLFHAKEGLGVFCGRQSQVGEWADSDQRHRIRLILAQCSQDLLVSRTPRGGERMILRISASLDGLDALVINRWVEEVLPSLTGSEVRVLYSTVR